MPTPRQYQSNADRQKAYRQRTGEARCKELERKGLPPTPAIPTMPGNARWNALIAEAAAALGTATAEMERYFEDRSEEWQEGERGASFQERLEALQTALEAVQEAADSQTA